MANINKLKQMNYGEIAEPDDVNDNFETLRVATNENTASIGDLVSRVDSIEPQVMPDFKYENEDNAFLGQFLLSREKNKITITKGTVIRLEVSSDDVRYLEAKDSDLTYNINSCLDTGVGSLSAGADYCVYLVAKDEIDEVNNEIIKTVDVKVSANATYPQGFSSSNSRKIGGFHTLCMAVTSANAPAQLDNTQHPAIGYNAGDLIPNSVWCLSHRPQSEPNGMVYIDKIDKWADIYLQGGKDGNLTSSFGARVIDTRQQINHQWDMLLCNKTLASDNDFITFAEGSNQRTAIYGSASPNPKTSGGHTDTAGKRMISKYFVEECCGYLWQWIDEIAPVGGSGWAGYGDGDSRGQSYGMPYCLLAGGYWTDATTCGSRSRYAGSGRSTTAANVGGRGVSLPLRV